LARFSWLHLSDLLLGPRGSLLMRPEYREAFESDLRRLHEDSGPWDVVFLTGNLTQSGTGQEFILLNSTLNSLWDYFRSLGSDPMLLAVPGERDLLGSSEMISTSGAAEVRAAFHQPADYTLRLDVQLGFRRYAEWSSAWRSSHPSSTLLDGLLPGDFATTVVADGMKVGVIGLNSAFRSDADNPESSREIHIEQIEAALPEDPLRWALQHDLILLLTHTPPKGLSLKPRMDLYERLIPSNRPFLHLCGAANLRGWIEPWPILQTNATWSRTLQTWSLFGVTGAEDPMAWGYAAGKLSKSEL
jgi:hypothetical protein